MLRAVAVSTCFTARRMIVVSVKPNIARSNPSLEAWQVEQFCSNAMRPTAASGPGVAGGGGGGALGFEEQAASMAMNETASLRMGLPSVGRTVGAGAVMP